MELSFAVRLAPHQEREQIVVNAELLIDLVEACILSLHKKVELFLRHNHLHKIGFNASGIGDEIDLLPFGRGISHEAHIELTHTGIVVVELGNDDLVDVLEVDAARQALLCAKHNSVSALLESFAERSALGKGGIAARNNE